MDYENYIRRVHTDKFTEGDFGRWVRFGDSYPPVDLKPYHGVIIEVLIDGDPQFESIYVCEDKTVRFLDYDSNLEVLEYGMWDDHYWRFVPDPPGNECYNCG